MYMGEKTKKSLDENHKTSQVMKDLIFPYFPQELKVGFLGTRDMYMY